MMNFMNKNKINGYDVWSFSEVTKDEFNDKREKPPKQHLGNTGKFLAFVVAFLIWYFLIGQY